MRYTRRATLPTEGGHHLPLKEWVRAEWQRSGLPMSQSNAACGVANAATRKYLTQCRHWYFPPGEAIEAMSRYCMEHGRPTARPHFSLDSDNLPRADEWNRLRAKWQHVHALTNVWQEPPVHGDERVKVSNGSGYLHANQKPLSLMRCQILASTDPGDVIWEPFGGLCSASIAAVQLDRVAQAAEMNPAFYGAAVDRMKAATTSAAKRERKVR